MTIRTCICSFVERSLGAKSRTILLLLFLLARIHLGSSTFAESCGTAEERAVSLDDGKKLWLRTTAESLQLHRCNLEKDSLYEVSRKNDTLVISAKNPSARDKCEINDTLLQVPNRSVFVSCRINRKRAEEELQEIIDASSHGTDSDFESDKLVRRAEKVDTDLTDEPPPSTSDLPTEVPELLTGEDEEQPLTSMAPEGARETPAPEDPRPPATPKLETTVSTIQMTPSETTLTTALTISSTIVTTPVATTMGTRLATTSPTIVPTPVATTKETILATTSPTIVPTPIATTKETRLATPSPTPRPTPTVPIAVSTTLLPSSPEATEPHEATSTEAAETTPEGSKEATKPPLLESTEPSNIMSYLPYIIGGAAGILLLLIFITIFVVVSRRRKKASVPSNLAAGRADYVRHQDALDSQDMANVNILMYAADEAPDHVQLEDIFDKNKDESSVPVIPKCLRDDNFE